MINRIKLQGLDFTPRILIVCSVNFWNNLAYVSFCFVILSLKLTLILLSYTQVTRLLPDAVGTTCGEHLEKVYGTEYSHILRVPFRTEEGIVRKWISRFEVWPYLETYPEVCIRLCS